MCHHMLCTALDVQMANEQQCAAISSHLRCLSHAEGGTSLARYQAKLGSGRRQQQVTGIL